MFDIDSKRSLRQACSRIEIRKKLSYSSTETYKCTLMRRLISSQHVPFRQSLQKTCSLQAVSTEHLFPSGSPYRTHASFRIFLQAHAFTSSSLDGLYRKPSLQQSLQNTRSHQAVCTEHRFPSGTLYGLYRTHVTIRQSLQNIRSHQAVSTGYTFPSGSLYRIHVPFRQSLRPLQTTRSIQAVSTVSTEHLFPSGSLYRTHVSLRMSLQTHAFPSSSLDGLYRTLVPFRQSRWSLQNTFCSGGLYGHYRTHVTFRQFLENTMFTQ
jgi:hypothetical protein